MAFLIPMKTDRGWDGICYAKVVKYSIHINKNIVEVFINIYKDALASDARYLPVSTRTQILTGNYFDTIYNRKGEPTIALQEIYKGIYETDTWWADNNAEEIYEMVKIDILEHSLETGDFISRAIASDFDLEEDIDFASVNADFLLP